MAEFHPRRIIGRWREGFALDLHTLSSTPIGYNEFGHMQFDTKRSGLGELLYRLKYNAEKSAASDIAHAAEIFVRRWNIGVDLIVPVPPSTARAIQPVIMVADELSRRIGIPVSLCVRRTREVPQLKNVYDLDERLQLLQGLHAVDSAAAEGKSILLFDDLYRSGATMNAIAGVLYEQGGATDVYALTVTQTRSYR